jgi:hypothetical protein
MKHAHSMAHTTFFKAKTECFKQCHSINQTVVKSNADFFVKCTPPAVPTKKLKPSPVPVPDMIYRDAYHRKSSFFRP